MNLKLLLIILALLLWSCVTDSALANIPFSNNQEVDPIPWQGPNDERTNSGITDTYAARAYETLDQSFIGKDIDFARGILAQRDGSKMLSPDNARNQYGLVTDTPVSDDYAQFASNQNQQDKDAADTLARGGDRGAGKTWLGFAIAVIANFCDPISMAICLAIAIFVKRWLVKLSLIIAWLSVQELLLSLPDGQYQTNAGIARITAGLIIIAGVALLKLALKKGDDHLAA